MLDSTRPKGVSGLTVFHNLLRLNSRYHLGPALNVLHGLEEEMFARLLPLEMGYIHNYGVKSLLY
jgi:hypothetical protein